MNYSVKAKNLNDTLEYMNETRMKTVLQDQKRT